MKKHLGYSHTFPTNRPDRVASVIGQSVTTRPPAAFYAYAYDTRSIQEDRILLPGYVMAMWWRLCLPKIAHFASENTAQEINCWQCIYPFVILKHHGVNLTRVQQSGYFTDKEYLKLPLFLEKTCLTILLDFLTIYTPSITLHLRNILPVYIQQNYSWIKLPLQTKKLLSLIQMAGKLRPSFYDKHDDFGFNTVNLPWLSGDVRIH